MAQSINTTVQNKPAWGVKTTPIQEMQSPSMRTANTTPYKTPLNVKGAIQSAILANSAMGNKRNMSVYTPPGKGASQSAPSQGLVDVPKSGAPSIATQPPAQGSSIQNSINSINAQIPGIQQGINNLKNQQAGSGTPSTKGLLQYPALVGRIADASNPSQNQNKLLQDLQSAGQGSVDIGKRAADLSEQYGNEIARVGQLGAGAVAGARSTGTNVVGAGNAAIASQSASSRIQALSQAQQAALQGTGQQLTAQQQLASALGTGLGAANVQQQQQISGLGTAAGYSQPVQIAPGSTLASPIGGETIAGGLGGYVPYRTAEQVMGLISQYPDAGYQYNPAMSPEQNLQAAQQAIQGSPTYQRSTYGVPGQSNVQGATAIQAAQQGYTQSSQNYNQLYAAYTNADNLANNVLGILEEGGINPVDVRYANQALQDIKRQLSSVEQQRFDTAMQEARNAFAGIVASYGGQTPTNIGEAYNTLLDPRSSLGAINASIEQLKLAGQTRLQAEYQQVQNYYNQLNSSSSQGGGSSDFDW